ncbi:hypothetical protein [Streptomyces pini]|uniref:PQQ-like domain-containing protein n=1 Tax=Streptomyces pini TaxID=1520580 RepID=A0A1I4C646_9ACTN|nr:hypothetical protein [Streptomyces pini]SFK76415.1 hypothetical protein SAMN05192584_108268 [Streptomyces pini]
MTTVRKALAAVVAAGLLAACGGSGDEGGTGGPGSAADGSGKPPIGAEKPLRTPVKAPEGFDTSKGWQETVTWLPEGARTAPVDAAPEAGIVAFLQRDGGAYSVEARDAVTGALRWKGEPWEPPAAEDDGGLSIRAPRIPRLLVVHEKGREYVVVWAHGLQGEDALSKGEKVISLALYPAGSSGEKVAPARTVTVPADTRSGDVEVRDGGDGLLVRWKDLGWNAAAVDVSTGRFETYRADQELPVYCRKVGCGSGEVGALSPAGPVIALSTRGFGVDGGWQASDAVPPGVDTQEYERYKDGRLWTTAGDHVISSWTAEDDPLGRPVWAVHDLSTGKLEMSAPCRTVERSADAPPRPVLSANGRYAVVGALALDFERGRAHCLGETDQRKGVRLLSVGDDGTAYGFAGGGGTTESAPVAVSLSTGEPEALPQGTEVPFLSLPEAGGFSPMADGGGLLFVFHPRG